MASAAIALAVILSACVPTGPVTDPTPDQQGPLPPTSALLTLQQLAAIVTADDAPAQALFDVGEASTSGADLLSEQQYWEDVGGSPEECRDIVSSPYLVSSADAADEALTDDPTGAIARFSEDEDLFGLVQVYGRIFDDEAAASGFIDRFAQTVAGCAGYQLAGADGAVTYQAVALHLDESTTAPDRHARARIPGGCRGIRDPRRRHHVRPAQERRDRDLLRAVPEQHHDARRRLRAGGHPVGATRRPLT